ncbi:hypothetical protein PUW25_25550 (plasmid) [Paenibacillus urinalis]|uniref:Uncharacterized protein n=1 Tax=Paenibacillus urinalis TaxID=521520 RepID=A0ABY7XHA8_9BACL|nr:hypothetical protein [Paenibacillus urinalis]WDI05177.1 hypothetical protein PUW25_25550 [Paenibacillus urinalis]
MNTMQVVELLDSILPLYPAAQNISRSLLMDILESEGIFIYEPDYSVTKAKSLLFEYLDNTYRYNFDAYGNLVSPEKIMHSAAGYYIGYDSYDFELDVCLHHDRISGYYKDIDKAKMALRVGVHYMMPPRLSFSM